MRLGADAVGYSMYVGSPAQDRDFIQLMGIREDCERFGMPLIVSGYPRGEAIDCAARVACELGADVIKLNIPVYDAQVHKDCPEP